MSLDKTVVMVIEGSVIEARSFETQEQADSFSNGYQTGMAALSKCPCGSFCLLLPNEEDELQARFPKEYARLDARLNALTETEETLDQRYVSPFV